MQGDERVEKTFVSSIDVTATHQKPIKTEKRTTYNRKQTSDNRFSDNRKQKTETENPQPTTDNLQQTTETEVEQPTTLSP